MSAPVFRDASSVQNSAATASSNQSLRPFAGTAYEDQIVRSERLPDGISEFTYTYRLHMKRPQPENPEDHQPDTLIAKVYLPVAMGSDVLSAIPSNKNAESSEHCELGLERMASA